MNPDWQNFLRAQGAVLDDGVVLRFERPSDAARPAQCDACIFDLSNYSVLQAAGPDAESFLNAQLSNDLAGLERGRAVLAAYCNAQGRVIALLRALRHGDGVGLLLPRGLAATVMERLRRYVLRSKVELSLLNATHVVLGMSGRGAEALVQANLGVKPPKGEFAHAPEHGASALRSTDIEARFTLICPVATAVDFWRSVERDVGARGSGIWRWREIVAGEPTVYPQTSEAFVPQMLNLDLLGGIDFQKGCYPGQEIVARMHYLGRLKQRMFRYRLSQAAAPGELIYAPSFGDQAAGTVVDAQPSPHDGLWDLLAVVQLSAAGDDGLSIEKEEKRRLLPAALPYALPAVERNN